MVSSLFFYGFCIIILLGILIQLKSVQTKAAHKILNMISGNTPFKVSVADVRISWLDKAVFNDLLILDDKNDTLLFAENVEVDYALIDVIGQDFMTVEGVSSNNVELNLVKYDSVSEMNIVSFLNSFNSDQKKESKPLAIDEINLENLRLSFQDHTKKEMDDRFDPAHFTLGFDDFILNGLQLSNDTLAFEIVDVSGQEQEGHLKIETFRSRFFLSNQMLSITDLEFSTPNSHLSDSIKLYYNGMGNLAHFMDSVSFGVYMSNSKVSQREVEALIGADVLKSDIEFEGVLRGSVGDFNLENARIGFGKGSELTGGISCLGLPDPHQTFVLAELNESRIIPEDIEPYAGKLAGYAAQLGTIDFTGSFAGFVKDFVARGDFVTEKGTIHTDINIKVPNKLEDMVYKGNLELKKVNIGTFVQTPELIQEVNFKGNIDGSGIKPDNANFSLNASMYESSIKGYYYDSLSAIGTFASNFFKGSFFVWDPYAKLSGDATLDFNKKEEVLDVHLYIDTLVAHELNFSGTELSVRGAIDVDVVDLDLDRFNGEIKMNTGIVVWDGHTIPFDSVRFQASLVGENRLFELDVPGLSATLDGAFKLSDAINDLTNIYHDYASSFNLQYDSVFVKNSGERYRMELRMDITDVDGYLDSLDLPVSIAPNSYLECVYGQGKDANISFYFESEKINYGKNEFFSPLMEINGSKELDSAGVLTSFIVQSGRQAIPGMLETTDLLLEGVWFNNDIDFTASIQQKATKSIIRLLANAELGNDTTRLKINPSDIVVFGDEWTFNPTNSIVFSGGGASIANLEIYKQNESIGIEGFVADNAWTFLTLTTEEFNLNKLSLVSELNTKGFLNSKFNIFRNHGDEPFQLDGGFQVDQFHFDDILIGEIIGASTWDPGQSSMYSTLEVVRENFSEVTIKGNYYPLEEENQLDFDLDFDHAELVIAESFLEEHLSSMSGWADGHLKITGNKSKPVVVGDCEIIEGGMTINYLNTPYTFDGRVLFRPSFLAFSDFSIEDRKGSTASISGVFHHDSFQEVTADITILADDFEFLNTTPVDNSLYYGTANGTGFIQVSGFLSDLLIQANVKTDKGTRFFIPVSENREVAQQDYITFMAFSDTAGLKQIVNEDIGLRGMTLDFDIEVTPDAYCELIFDIKSGDIIRGRGRGNLKLTMDTDGEFYMFGPLEITEGGYNYTVKGILNKEFEVMPGSRITWYGEPYDAILDLEATYLQRASLEELKNEENRDENQLNNKKPVNVVLNLNGGMLSPQIGFDLRLSRDLEDENAQSLLAQIVNDEQELRKQVISLLLLKRFSPKESFSLGEGGYIVGSSLSELVSSQVGYLVSQLDENLELEVDLASFDQDAFQTFQLRLSYTFLGGRLKVTRGGGFDNEKTEQNDIVGDWSVEYSLAKDGKLRAKVFRTTNQRFSQQAQQNYETGLSLRFVHSFNDVMELLSIRRQKTIGRKEEDFDLDGSGEETNPLWNNKL